MSQIEFYVMLAALAVVIVLQVLALLRGRAASDTSSDTTSAGLADLLAYLDGAPEVATHRPAVLAYRERYGV